jgi:Tol biopolymer transport system component
VDNFGAAAVSASSTGAIVYRTGAANRLRQTMRVDRTGTQVGEPFAPDPQNPENLSLSPDARQLALDRTVAGNIDLWILDLERRAFTRLTRTPTPDAFPVWSPKGDRIAYAAAGPGGLDLWQIPTSGTNEGALLLQGPLAEVPLDWSRDGRFLLYRSQPDPSTGADLWALPMDGPPTPLPVARTRADEIQGAFSPDGRWVAVVSDETGRTEVYLRFPAAPARTLISTGGGLQPQWRPDGRELFYVAPDGRLMAVALRLDATSGSVQPALPVPLFTTHVGSTRTGASRQEYVVTADGRFLMNTLLEQSGNPITLVLRR